MIYLHFCCCSRGSSVFQFFATDIFVKKGGFATMWLAGSGVMRRISKATVMQAAIEKLAASIANPPVPLALRASSTLVLGVTRLHNRKTTYVLADAQEIQTKLRSDAHRAGDPVVDLPVTGAAARAAEQVNAPDFEFDAQFDFGFQELHMEAESGEYGAPISLGAERGAHALQLVSAVKSHTHAFILHSLSQTRPPRRLVRRLLGDPVV